MQVQFPDLVIQKNKVNLNGHQNGIKKSQNSMRQRNQSVGHQFG